MFNRHPNIRQLHIELAARAVMDGKTESRHQAGRVDYDTYRFDTRHICGDFTEVHVLKAFSSEETARHGLAEILANEA